MSFNFFRATCIHEFSDRWSNDFLWERSWNSLLMTCFFNWFLLCCTVLFGWGLFFSFSIVIAIFCVRIILFDFFFCCCSWRYFFTDFFVLSLYVNQFRWWWSKRSDILTFSSFELTLQDFNSRDLNESFTSHFLAVPHDLVNARRETAKPASTF